MIIMLFLSFSLSFQLNELTEAEDALSEANILNNSDPEVWGYLSLVCLKTGRQLEAEQAYKYAIKVKGATFYSSIMVLIQACKELNSNADIIIIQLVFGLKYHQLVKCKCYGETAWMKRLALGSVGRASDRE